MRPDAVNGKPEGTLQTPNSNEETAGCTEFVMSKCKKAKKKTQTTGKGRFLCLA